LNIENTANITLLTPHGKRVLTVNRELYSAANSDLVYEWTEKWLTLIDLINSVSGTDQPPWSPPPPTELQGIDYQRLRFWFIDHQSQFMPLWREFYESHDWACPLGDNNKDEDFPQGYLGNPFLFFYEPENLYHLARQLDLQSGIDIWEPSEYRARVIRPVFIRLGELLLGFLDWVDKREHGRPRNESAY
jgi:hypothetical protein